MSKRYDPESPSYWYAFHPPWATFLHDGATSFVVLAAMDSNTAYAIPYDVFESLLPKLNQTVNEDRHYWHVAVAQSVSGGAAINLSKVRAQLDLEPFAFPLAKTAKP